MVAFVQSEIDSESKVLHLLNTERGVHSLATGRCNIKLLTHKRSRQVQTYTSCFSSNSSDMFQEFL